jgi:hypothetical protein
MKINARAILHVSWKAMVMRFVFGGTISVISAFTAVAVSPLAGGILLAFPTILPAAVTLLEKREGKDASLSDLSGAVFGACGMLAFALVLIPLSTSVPGAVALTVAAVVWLIVSVSGYLLLHDHGPWKQHERREIAEGMGRGAAATANARRSSYRNVRG